MDYYNDNDFTVAKIRLHATEETHNTNRRETYELMEGGKFVGNATKTRTNRTTDEFDGVKYRELYTWDIWVEEKSSTKVFAELLMAEAREARERGADETGAVDGTGATEHEYILNALAKSGRRYVKRKTTADTVRTRKIVYSEFFFRETRFLYYGATATPCMTFQQYTPTPIASLVVKWSLEKTDETPHAVPIDGRLPDNNTTTTNVPIGRLAELPRKNWLGECETRQLLHRRLATHIRRWVNGKETGGSEENRWSEVVLPLLALSDFRLREGSKRVKVLRNGERCGDFLVQNWEARDSPDWARIEEVRTMRDELKRGIAERVFEPARVSRMAKAYGMEEDEYLERV